MTWIISAASGLRVPVTFITSDFIARKGCAHRYRFAAVCPVHGYQYGSACAAAAVYLHRLVGLQGCHRADIFSAHLLQAVYLETVDQNQRGAVTACGVDGRDIHQIVFAHFIYRELLYLFWLEGLHGFRGRYAAVDNYYCAVLVCDRDLGRRPVNTFGLPLRRDCSRGGNHNGR